MNSLFAGKATAHLLDKSQGANHVASPWTSFYRRRSEAKVRLFCLHHAGGGASAFKSWLPSIPGWIDIVSLQMPGREERLSETPLTFIDPLMDALSRTIRSFDPIPYAFFGHSMGGLVSFILARKLQYAETQMAHPSHLFISATPPPRAKKAETEADLTDESLVAEMIKLGGTPKELLESADYRNFILPAMRADAELCERLKESSLEPVDADMTIMFGQRDPMMSMTDALGWKPLTTGKFDIQPFGGDHFYLREHKDQVIDLLVKRLAALAL